MSSNVVELITRLRDGLSGPLSKQQERMEAWNRAAVMMITTVTTVATALVQGTRQIIRFTDAQTQMAGQLYDAAVAARVSAQDLSSLQFVVEQAGGSAEGLPMAFQKMSTALYDARDAASPAAQALRDIGVSIEDLRGMSVSDQFRTLAGAVSEVSDAQTRANAGQTLFGRGVIQLRGFLTLTTDEIKAAEDAAKDMGVVMSNDGAAAADRFQDALAALKDRFNALAVEGLEPLLPKITTFLAQLLNLAEDALPYLIEEGRATISFMSDLAKIAGVVFDVLKFLDGVMGDSSEGTSKWDAVLNSLLPGLGLLASRFRGVGNALGITSTTMVDASSQAEVITAAFDAVRGVVEQTITELALYNTQLEAIAERAETARRGKKDAGFVDPMAGTGGGAAADMEKALSSLAERMQEIKVAELAAIDEAAQAEIDALAERKELMAEQYNAEMQTIRDTATARKAALAEEARLRQQIIDRGVQGAARFGSGLYFAAQTGRRGLDQWRDTFIANLEQIMIQKAFGFVMNLLSMGGLGGVFGFLGGLFQTGGEVRKAATGYVVPGSGYGDRTPIMAEPGEVVLSRDSVREMRNAAGTSSSRGRGNVIHLHYSPTISTATDAEMARAAGPILELLRREGIA